MIQEGSIDFLGDSRRVYGFSGCFNRGLWVSRVIQEGCTNFLGDSKDNSENGCLADGVP